MIDSDQIRIKVVDGTTYSSLTDDKVIKVLEMARKAGIRLKIEYGDAVKGTRWLDILVGYIGRSVGPTKIPIILHNTLSMGGMGILDHCIVRISHSNKKNGGDMYKHPRYKS